jgi:uncharacterized protein (AIM24 family)
MAQILDSGGRITMVVQKSHAIFIRRDKMIQSEGTVNVSVAMPSPQHATIARLLNNAFVMQKITTDTNGGRVVLTCPGGRQLIGIRLSKDDRLAISFSHVVGFSKCPRFASFANLSVAAFACDRNFATIASGPGILLLETNGNHVVHTNGTIVLDPDQLIAWDPAMRFRLDRIHGLSDLYLNRVRISCTVTPELLPLIVDSAPKKGATSVNPLWGFLKSVYWPRFH